jgi:dihydrofolate reductase
MRKLKYCVDCTLDGFIARHDHSYDFLPSEGEHLTDFLETINQFDIALMGRNTYEVGLKAGVIDPSLSMRQYVISSSLTRTIDERIKIISSDIKKFVIGLKSEKGKDILLSGGSILATKMLSENLIDELQLRVHPVLIGSGIALFNKHEDVSVRLIQQKEYSNAVVLNVYSI